jgi:hypothetical protein
MFAVDVRTRPYTLPWTGRYAPRKPSSHTVPATNPTKFVAALGEPQKMTRNKPGAVPEFRGA